MTPAGQAITVAGPVPVAALGVTTMHEHLWMDSRPLLAIHGYAAGVDRPWDAAVAAEARWAPGIHPDNYRLTDAGADVLATEAARLAHNAKQANCRLAARRGTSPKTA